MLSMTDKKLNILAPAMGMPYFGHTGIGPAYVFASRPVYDVLLDVLGEARCWKEVAAGAG